jgi:hypothetical protein
MTRSFLKFCETNPDAAQAKLEAAGNKIAALRKRGICTHGWLQGPSRYPATARDNVLCLDCGAVFATMDDAYEAGKAAMRNN